MRDPSGRQRFDGAVRWGPRRRRRACRGADLRQLAALHRRGRRDRRVPHPPAVHRGNRDRGRLPGGDPGEHRVLRHHPAGTRGRPGHGLGHDRGDGLDGRQDDRARLSRGLRRCRQRPELRGQRGRQVQEPELRPRQPAQRAVAVGHHRHRLQPRSDRAGDHRLRGPARPGVRGSDRHVQRLARHRSASRSSTRHPAEGCDRG